MASPKYTATATTSVSSAGVSSLYLKLVFDHAVDIPKTAESAVLINIKSYEKTLPTSFTKESSNTIGIKFTLSESQNLSLQIDSKSFLQEYDKDLIRSFSTFTLTPTFDKLKELAIPVVQSDTYYGTNKDDIINTPNLGLGERTLIDPGPGNDTVIAEKFQGIVGGIGYDNIKGVSESKISIQYWGSYFDNSINANFNTGIVNKKSNEFDLATNINTISTSSGAIITAGKSPLSYFSPYNTTINGNNVTTVVYYNRAPEDFNINYDSILKKWTLTYKSGGWTDSFTDIIGFQFSNSNLYRIYSALSASNIESFNLSENYVGFKKQKDQLIIDGTRGIPAYDYKTADFNSDGVLDIFVTRVNFEEWQFYPVNIKGSPVSVLIGNGKGGFSDKTNEYIENALFRSYGAGSLIADFNNDSRSDVLLIQNGTDRHTPGWQNDILISSLLTKKLIPSTNLLPTIIQYNHRGATGDVNGDGLLDIIVNAFDYTRENITDQIYIQQTNGSFRNSPELIPIQYIKDWRNINVPISNLSSKLIDLNLDGNLDLILGSWAAGSDKPEILSKVLLNNGKGDFTKIPPINLPSSAILPIDYGFLDFQPIDLNGDNYPDIINTGLLGYHGPYIQTLINNKGQSFTDETDARFPQNLNFKISGNYNYNDIQVADFNRDGYPDIVGQGPESGLAIFMNDGKGRFTQFFQSPSGTCASAIGDFNQDGMIDLVIGTKMGSNVEFWSNELVNQHIYKANFGGENLLGSITRDSFYPRNGKNIFDGNAGIDSMHISDSINNYSIRNNLSEWSFNSRLKTSDSTSIKNIERVYFSDVSIAIDLNGNAGTTAKILGAVFGKESLTNKSYVGIGLHFLDNGWSYDNLAALALDAAGAKTNDQIVSLLWTNVMGKQPTAADKAPFITLLENGMTAGALAHLAADTSFNTTNINLVGLAQTGISFIPV